METLSLPWTDEYAIGHAGLDREHRQLVAAINEICSIKCADDAPDQLRPLLDALTIATVEHFKHENSLLRELSSWASGLQADRQAIPNIMSAAAINEHCAEHAQVLLRLESIIHAFYFGANSDRGHLGKTLVDWFVEHALKHDADLRDVLHAYFTASKASASDSQYDRFGS
jgi:hemerythrin